MKPKAVAVAVSAIVVWDRVCAASWRCSQEHARAVRLFFTGGFCESWREQQCEAKCRCPKAVLLAGPRGET